MRLWTTSRKSKERSIVVLLSVTALLRSVAVPITTRDIMPIGRSAFHGHVYRVYNMISADIHFETTTDPFGYL